MIAQILDSKDKYELIEHTYSLGRISQQELLFFYAYEVFERHDTTDLSDAVFALAKIIESYSAGPHVYNLYGLLLEKQGLLGPALDAFDNCLAIVESENIREVVFENRARVLSSLGRFEDSMASWEERLEYPVQDPFTYAGYGMTLYFNGNYQEAIKTYQKAIEMTKKDSTVNEITMGLCQVLFALGTPENIDLAKGYLLECFNRNNNFVKAIICLFTVGLKLQNWDLVQSAAIELEKLAPHILAPYAYEIESLLCKLYVLKGQTVKAKSSLLSSVYQSPTKSRWIRLALFLKK
jgi:tetratricopeptide (TPR) repeat protein